MVHLSAIHKDDGDSSSASHSQSQSQAAKLAEKAHNLLHLSNYSDDFSTSVYGSRFAGEDLPKNKMPECQMPREIAYRMIKDDLSLDNNPKLK